MAKKPLITSRDPKGLHFISLCEAAYNKAQLDDDRAQRLNERGDELQAGLAKLIAKLSATEYPDEEVASNYGYPLGYQPKSIVGQVATLRQLFPELREATFDESVAARPLPAGAEGWFAISRWQAIASTYNEAVEKVLAAIANQRQGKFRNWREGCLGAQYLRQHKWSIASWKKLGDQQRGHDILVVPAQFGLRHCGHSVRRAREVFTPNEFGLGAFAVGIMLLTHPERLQYCDDLWIDCAGDEYSSGDGPFDGAPYFLFGDYELKFDYHWFGFACDGCGSASAFAE